MLDAKRPTKPEPWNNHLRAPSCVPMGESKYLLSQTLVVVQDSKGFPILELPLDVQRLIFRNVPLRDLARLACLSKDLRAAYRDRTAVRNATVAKVLGSHFTAEFREGLTPAQTALPSDLIVDPPVRGASIADEHET